MPVQLIIFLNSLKFNLDQLGRGENEKYRDEIVYNIYYFEEHDCYAKVTFNSKKSVSSELFVLRCYKLPPCNALKEQGGR